jgi:hypothetical protein
MIILVLVGCVENSNQQYGVYQPATQEEQFIETEVALAETKDIYTTLKTYKHFFEPLASNENCMTLLTSMFTTVSSEDAPCFVFTSQQYNSDRCILVRRAAKPTKTCYFNYTKYLPKEFNNYTEDDFLDMVNVYSQISKHKQVCHSDTNLTSTERLLCADKIDKYMHDFAHYKAKNNSGLKKCSSVNSQKYKELFIEAPSGYNVRDWFSQELKNAKCNNKNKKEFMKHAQAVAECGVVLFDRVNRACKGEYEAFVKEEQIQMHKKEQIQRFVDFGIENNCYISLNQLIKDNYDAALKTYNSGCNKPVKKFKIYNPVIDVRLVD